MGAICMKVGQLTTLGRAQILVMKIIMLLTEISHLMRLRFIAGRVINLTMLIKKFLLELAAKLIVRS